MIFRIRLSNVSVVRLYEVRSFVNAIEAGLNKSTTGQNLCSDIWIHLIASALLGSDHDEKQHGIVYVQKQ
jgi:hypothetical protein